MGKISEDLEYEVKMARISELLDAELGTPEGDELERLSDEVEAYEKQRWPLDYDERDVSRINEVLAKGEKPLPWWFVRKTLFLTEEEFERVLAIVATAEPTEALKELFKSEDPDETSSS